MDSFIKVEDVSLKFKLYSDKGMGLKEALINSIVKRQKRINIKEFWVLNNINFTINKGEKVAFIGNNGAGKSTLLKLIANIYIPTKGRITSCGKIVPLIELGAGFNPELTGRENIYLNGAILGYSREQIKKVEKDIIDFSELGEFIDVPIKYYSTGMYGRLAFTVATQIEPEILIIDEIFAGGDINFIDKAKNRMNNLINGSQIVLVVSHNLDLLKGLCKRGIVISQNSISFDGDIEEAIDFYKKINA